MIKILIVSILFSIHQIKADDDNMLNKFKQYVYSFFSSKDNIKKIKKPQQYDSVQIFTETETEHETPTESDSIEFINIRGKKDKKYKEPLYKQLPQKKLIYLDYNSSTLFSDREVIKFFLDLLKYPGNPSSSHKRGIFLNKVLCYSKKIFSKILNCENNEIFFTSGATESNNIAILGYVRSLPKNSEIITISTEHASVIEPFKELQKEGYKCIFAPVNKYGELEMQTLKALISKQTKFISISIVNNEIGTIQNIKKISELCKKHNIILHTDATQAFCKMNLNVKDLNVDMLTAASHKSHSIPGTGLLYIAQNIQKKIHPLFFGGKQQNSIRPGSIYIPLIATFAKSSEILYKNLNENITKLKELTNYAHKEILKINDFVEPIHTLPVIELNSNINSTIPGTLNYNIRGVDKEDLQKYLGNFIFSFGSACNSSEDFSYVINAIDKNTDKSPVNIRISFDQNIKESQLKSFIKQLKKTIIFLRNNFPEKGKKNCKINEVNLDLD